MTKLFNSTNKQKLCSSALLSLRSIAVTTSLWPSKVEMGSFPALLACQTLIVLSLEELKIVSPTCLTCWETQRPKLKALSLNVRIKFYFPKFFYMLIPQQSKVYPCANSVMTRWHVFQLSKPSCLTNITTNHASQ